MIIGSSGPSIPTRQECRAMPYAIEAEQLEKTFTGKHEVRALDGVSFNVAEGTVFGLLGPNGSGQDHRGADSDHHPPGRRRAGPGARPRRGQEGQPGPEPDRPGRPVRRRRREPDRPREPRDGREPQPPASVRGRPAGPRSCWRSSTWPTPATGPSRPTRAACAAASTWPPPWWPGRRCSSSTSPPPASTRRAATTCGRSSSSWSAAGPPSCSPPSTSRRPTAWPTPWWSSTTDGSSPRARRRS